MFAAYIHKHTRLPLWRANSVASFITWSNPLAQLNIAWKRLML